MTTAPGPATAAGCPAASPVKEPSGPSAASSVVQQAADGKPEIDLVRYPRPTTPGNPWSQWGQGLVLGDGRFLSAIGNHLGKDGNAFLYVYDPASGKLAQFADVRAGAGDALDWGYGKVHGQIVRGPCGDAYFATYWGSSTGLTYTPHYRGDLLFHVDPASLTITAQGSPVPARGLPSLASTTDGSMIYGEGVDPVASRKAGHDVGTFFAYDPSTHATVFTADVATHQGFRNVLVDARGDAYVAEVGGRLLKYEPGASALVDAGIKLPGGGWLRASTRPGPDGTVYGATTAPDRYFALEADGTVVDLGAAPGYTTSLALAPDGSRFYAVPGAHGEGPATGTPLLSVDTKTGEQTPLARLDDLTRSALGLRAGGSYDLALDATGSRLYVGLNAGTDPADPWGEVVLAVVHLTEGTVAAPATAPSSTGATTSKSTKSKSTKSKSTTSKSTKSKSTKSKSSAARSRRTTTTTAASGAAAACRTTGSPAVVYEAATSGTPGPVKLQDATSAWGAEAPLTGMQAHAIATADVNGDGWTDVFVGSFADRPAAEYRQRGATGPSPDRLLLGGPDGFHVDPTFPQELARTSGAAFADLDGDGDPDLVVSRNVRGTDPGRLPTTIYRNDGGKLVKAATLPEPTGGRSVGVLDYNGDGRPDLFIGEDRFAGGSSVLLRNDGNFTFTDVTEAAGIPRGVAGMGIGTGDLNGDGKPDLFVGGANRLFLNQGGGRFAEQVGAVAPWPVYGKEDDPAGVTEGDVNGDGRPDLVIGQHYNSTLDAAKRVPIRLYLNEPGPNGGVQLRDVTDVSGLIGLATKSPHVDIADLDGDGRPDLVTTAGGGDGTQPIVFHNDGNVDGVPRFTASAPTGSRQYWVTGAVFDADHDGRPDVVLAEWYPTLPTRFLRNVGATGHWLDVTGTPATTVTVYTAGGLGQDAARLGTQTIGASTGYSAGPTGDAWFGLGDATKVDVRISTPGQRPVDLRAVKVDRQVACDTRAP